MSRCLARQADGQLVIGAERRLDAAAPLTFATPNRLPFTKLDRPERVPLPRFNSVFMTVELRPEYCVVALRLG